MVNVSHFNLCDYVSFVYITSIAPKVVTAVKAVTTADVFSGLIHAVKQVVHNTSVNAIMVGTTHFINALIQRRDLAKVCIIRLCGTTTRSIPPMSNWSQDLKDAVLEKLDQSSPVLLCALLG